MVKYFTAVGKVIVEPKGSLNLDLCNFSHVVQADDADEAFGYIHRRHQ